MNLLKPIQTLFELLAIPGAEPGFLAFFIFAKSAIPATPATGRLSAIAFDLNRKFMVSVVIQGRRGNDQNVGATRSPCARTAPPRAVSTARMGK